tara:strand:+ start:21579 stop:22517 length:939 start_codon:yes stop_codon:yes gene_type:complete
LRAANSQGPGAGALRIDYFYQTADGDTADPRSYDFPMHYVHIDGWSFTFVQQGLSYNQEPQLDEVAGFDDQNNVIYASPNGEAEVVREQVSYQKTNGVGTMTVNMIKSKSSTAPASIRKKLAAGVEFLLARGVAAITGDCGFCVYFQQVIADLAKRRAPIMMSALMLAPMLPLMYNPTSRFVICTANSATLDVNGVFEILSELDYGGLSPLDSLLEARFVVAGFQNVPGFGVELKDGLPIYRTPALAREFVNAITAVLDKSFVDNAPNGVIFECTEMGQFTNDVRRAFPNAVVLNSVNVLEIARLGKVESPY